MNITIFSNNTKDGAYFSDNGVMKLENTIFVMWLNVKNAMKMG